MDIDKKKKQDQAAQKPKDEPGVEVEEIESTEPEADYEVTPYEEPKFDSEGNLLESADDEPEEETDVDDEPELEVEDDDEPDADEAEYDYEDEEPEPEDEDEEEPVKARGKKKLSPAEIKVINLKKENKRLLEQQRKAEEELAAKEAQKERENLKNKYIEDGYDEDTAENMSKTELRLKQIEEKADLFEFKEQNQSVFSKYPEAARDIRSIMRNSKVTGMTAEQICRGMYGSPSMSRNEESAMLSAKGESTRQTGRKPGTNSANRTTGKSKANYSAKDLRFKRELELRFLDGKPMSDEQFKKYIE